jgi:hypothetical protein
VLATNGLDAPHLSDADLLRASKGQSAVELSVKGAKNPAAMAPICLEPPTRMVARGCVPVIALRVATRVERQGRKGLEEVSPLSIRWLTRAEEVSHAT